MKNILVTGGAGFIGSNFIIHMLKRHDDINIINLDVLTYAANLASVKDADRYKFIKGNICGSNIVSEVLNIYNITAIVNFAAESHVDRSIAEPSIFAQSNIMGVVNMLKCAQQYWKDNFEDKLILQVSTDEVYGSLESKGYFTESSNISPNNPYAASKAAADLLLISWHKTYSMPIVISRCSNNYGPRQHSEKLIPSIIKNAYCKKPITIYGDGQNIRDWIHVSDHCRALDMLMSKGNIGEVYNIGDHNEHSNIDIAKLIIKHMHDYIDEGINEQLIEFVKDRLAHDRRYAIDNRKLVNEIDWKAEIDFNKGIIDTIEWYVNAIKD